MANKYIHMTASGDLDKRVSQNRTYTHVVILHRPTTYQEGTDYKGQPIMRPAGHYVVSWVGRPDLTASAVKGMQRYCRHGETCYAEAINNGTRA
jgi:hypothetical protein